VGRAAQVWAALSRERAREFWATLAGRPAHFSLFVLKKIQFLYYFPDLSAESI
jgi:hypothetical protein